MRSGRHVSDVEGSNVRRVLEHGTQLPGEALELVISQVKASQARHVSGVGTGDGISHVRDRRGEQGCLRSAAVEVLCQSCGADPRDRGSAVTRGDIADGKCPSCGRSLELSFGRALLSEDDPAVEYEFEGWEPDDRAAASEILTSRVVPFRWEPGLIMAVAPYREADVDAILDTLEESAEAESADGALAEADEDWGEGEDAFAALGDLYDAADRLFHTPTGSVAANDLREAGAIVRAAPPPFGFNPVLWRTAGELAEQLEGQLNEGSVDDVQAAAEALRDVLAEHI